MNTKKLGGWSFSIIVFLILIGCDSAPKPTAVSATLPPSVRTTSTAEPTISLTPNRNLESTLESAEPPTSTPLPSYTTTPIATPASFSPADLQVTITSRTRGNYATLFIQGNLVFISLGNKLIILDVSTPSQPVLISETSLQTWIKRIQVVGHTLYALLEAPAWNEELTGLQIMDVTDPANPIIQAFYDPLGLLAIDAVVINEVAHIVGHAYRWDAVDVSNPNAPEFINSIIKTEYWDCHGGGRVFYQIEAISDQVYLHNGSCRYGGRSISIYDVTNPYNPDSVKSVGTLPGGLDVVFSGDYAYTFMSYAGTFLRVLDISDSEAPGIVGDLSIPEPHYTLQAGHLGLIDHFLFLASSEGLYIVDVSDPFHLNLVQTLYSEVYFNDIEIVDGLGYLLDWDNGLLILDVTNPADPVEVGIWQQ